MCLVLLGVLPRHKHVHSLLRGDHVRGAVGADDSGQSVAVVTGVEHGAREVVYRRRRRPSRVRQHVAHVSVEAGIQWQLIEDDVVYPSQTESASNKDTFILLVTQHNKDIFILPVTQTKTYLYSR